MARKGQSKTDASRAERLAAELRENLKRRKARERAMARPRRDEGTATSAPEDDGDSRPR